LRSAHPHTGIDAGRKRPALHGRPREPPAPEPPVAAAEDQDAEHRLQALHAAHHAHGAHAHARATAAAPHRAPLLKEKVWTSGGTVCTFSFVQGNAKGSDFDPFCKEGLTDTSLSACCQADCGECADGSDVCEAKGENGRGSTCCPSEILSADVPCDESHAPCVLKPAPVDLTSEAGVRNAIMDCKMSVKAESDRQRVATDYVKHAEKKMKPSTTLDCNGDTLGPDTEWKSVEEIAYACEQRDGCGGFTMEDGKPHCLLSEADDADMGKIVSAPGVDTYLRVVNKKGLSFRVIAGAWSACSVTCGTGKRTRKLLCESEMGTDDSIERCMGLFSVAGLPHTEEVCNDFGCACEADQVITSNKVDLSNTVELAYDSTGTFTCSTGNVHTTGTVQYHCDDWEVGQLTKTGGKCWHKCITPLSYKGREIAIPTETGTLEHDKSVVLKCPERDFTNGGMKDLELYCDDGTLEITNEEPDEHGEHGECFKRCTLESINGAVSGVPTIHEDLYHLESRSYNCNNGGMLTVHCEDGEVKVEGSCGK